MSFHIVESHITLYFIRALAAVELNNYIAILAPPNTQKNPYSSGAILNFFSSIATVHIYL